MHADHASLTVEGGAQRRREGPIVQPARKPERPGVAGLAAKRDLAVHRQAERQATQWLTFQPDDGLRPVRPYRKSVVSGTVVSVHVLPGWRLIIYNKR